MFRRRRWFQGRPIRGTVDIGWFKPDGTEMNDEDWEMRLRQLGRRLPQRRRHPRPDRRGQRVTDDSFLLLFNAHSGPIDWTLPEQWGKQWQAVFDTWDHDREGDVFDSGLVFSVAGRSLVVFQRSDPAE